PPGAQAIALTGTGPLSAWSLGLRQGDSLQLTAGEWSGAGEVRLLDSEGVERGRWHPASQPSFTLTSPVAGPLLLQVDHPAGGSFRLNAQWGDTEPAVLPAPVLNGSGVIRNGETAHFPIEIKQAGLWLLDRQGALGDGSGFASNLDVMLH
ncbi:hypothetical protein, partial [Parachitinimonas caeni]